MADAGKFEDKPKKKIQKAKFSASEVSLLTEKVEENLPVLQSKLTNAVTNAKKIEIWAKITLSINALGVENRTVQEVQNKWKNLTTLATREFAVLQKETNKTGGGPAPKRPNANTTKIMEIFKDKPSFKGLTGFESLPGKWR